LPGKTKDRLAVCGLLGMTQLHPHRCDEIAPIYINTTHSPCFQLHARLAKAIAGFAGRLLPHRFSPYQFSLARSGLPVWRVSSLLRL